ncbi:putative AC transposase [Hypsizygus marmoreus]|uniref:AC transposase n=1 Tax=Hypsizygus marmoreus TaxID=39966 RepID=A0A369IYX4_HYPMA|nr:putative AC transposase [Hypsizygus marmoreus]
MISGIAKKRSRVIDNATDVPSGSETDPAPRVTMQDKSRDVSEFFEPAQRIDGKPRRRCKICTAHKPIVNKVTTLRYHIESQHYALYHRWAGKNTFESKLPKDVKARKDAETAANQEKQSTLDPHLRDVPPKERTIPYSDKLFREAAIEWLIATDQPLQALEHPKFIEMIDVASRATNGVKIPNRKATRQHIIDLFKKNLTDLQRRLSSDAVSGEVSLTCDAWQASNTDAYFAVTGHWTEEVSPGVWDDKSALFGFTQMNTSHDGVRLGRALFRIVKRLGIVHKIGWITCDNASNNLTMLKEFGRCMNTNNARKNMKSWEYKACHIRCLAHIINLATQAVIGTYSKTKHFDPTNPDDHVPDTTALRRDEVGLVRAIVVKARSSAKCKERFKSIQLREKIVALMLLIDMVVRWSSTYIMLKRAEVLQKFVDTFVYEIGLEEPDLQKRAKLDALKLTPDEWKRVKKFIDLLAHSDRAQQAFSSENTPTLHNAVPALEALHAAWSARRDRDKYEDFSTALTAGLEKIEEYYEKTSESHAYTFAMLLDPNTKMSHFEKHWEKDLQDEVLESAEEIFKERYIEMYGAAGAPRQRSSAHQSKIARLLAENSSDDESTDDEAGPQPTAGQESKPWLQEFNQYLKSTDTVPKGMTVTRWWGMNAQRLPMWGSLARDYLAIMGSSVSSECAFSQAGITISKRQNRLHEDIVEALQFLKCAIRKDLIYREAPTSVLELTVLAEDDDGDPEWEDVGEAKAWDILIDVDGDEDDE